METLAYALKVNAAFAVLFVTYWAVMRQETWFAARRAWLLGAALLSSLLPLVPVTALPATPISVTLPEIAVQELAAGSWSPTPTMVLIVVHVAVTCLLLLRLLFRSGRAILSMRRPVSEACSFLRTVRIPDQVVGSEAAAMRHHENVHARQLHSLDVVFFEVLTALWWSNPLWWLAKREVRLVHEYAADAQARVHHEHYEQLLLAKAMGTNASTLVHHFRSSNLRTRIAMLYNTRSPRSTRPKLMLSIPVLALTLVLVSPPAPEVPAPGCAPAPSTTLFQNAEFPGGMEALATYIQQTIKYPWYSKQLAVQGTVHVQFTIATDGTITDASILKGVHEPLDAEALRVVLSMPKWNPGMADGNPVASTLTLPIRFDLGPRQLFLDRILEPKKDGC
jgi:TonB family protein